MNKYYDLLDLISIISNDEIRSFDMEFNLANINILSYLETVE